MTGTARVAVALALASALFALPSWAQSSCAKGIIDALDAPAPEADQAWSMLDDPMQRGCRSYWLALIGLNADSTTLPRLIALADRHARSLDSLPSLSRYPVSPLQAIGLLAGSQSDPTVRNKAVAALMERTATAFWLERLPSAKTRGLSATSVRRMAALYLAGSAILALRTTRSDTATSLLHRLQNDPLQPRKLRTTAATAAQDAAQVMRYPSLRTYLRWQARQPSLLTP